MDKINELRMRTAALLQEVGRTAKQQNLQEKEKKLIYFANRLQKGRTIAVVCGEFKRGKSSFVNAFVEDSSLCPVDIDITTNMATQIQYSDKEYTRVYFRKETEKPPINIARTDLPKYVTEAGNKENAEMVQLVDIGIPKERLKKNVLVLVDTPGVGSLNVKHSEVSAAYLAIADVVLFVCDATAPLTSAELEFVKRARKYCSSIYFILSKIDMVREWKLILEENRKKIADTISVPPESVKIFPVSSRDKIEYLETGDEECYEDSRYAELEASIDKELSGSIAQNILLKPLSAAKKDIESIKKSLLTQLQALQQDNKEKKKDIEEKLKEANENHKMLQRSSSKWQMVFNDDSMDIKRKMRKSINDGFIRLEKEIREKVKDSSFKGNVENVNAFIKNSIIDIMKDTDSIVNESVKEMQEKIYSIIGKEIDIEAVNFSQIDTVGIENDALTDDRGSAEKFRDFGRNIAMSTTSFTAGGSLIGGAMGGIVGTLIGVGPLIGATSGAKIGSLFGVVVGGLFGVKSHPKEINKRLEADAVKACLEVLRENRVNCVEYSEVEMSQILSQIKSSIIFNIQDSMETIEKTREEISKTMGENNSETVEKIKKLQDLIKNVSVTEKKVVDTLLEVQKL